VIHLIGPVVLAAALAGTGVYGLLARRNAILVLIGAELILNAANVLLVTANLLPAGGLAALTTSATPAVGPGAGDPLLSGQVMAIFVVTIAAAEIGLALAVILLLFRRRSTSDLGQVRDLGEASPDYAPPDDAGAWPEQAAPSTEPAAPDGTGTDGDGDGDDRTAAAIAGTPSEVRS
jgi:NADH-quinone oxidoreductase subunit K